MPPMPQRSYNYQPPPDVVGRAPPPESLPVFHFPTPTPTPTPKPELTSLNPPPGPGIVPVYRDPPVPPAPMVRPPSPPEPKPTANKAVEVPGGGSEPVAVSEPSVNHDPSACAHLPAVHRGASLAVPAAGYEGFQIEEGGEEAAKCGPISFQASSDSD